MASTLHAFHISDLFPGVNRTQMLIDTTAFIAVASLVMGALGFAVVLVLLRL